MINVEHLNKTFFSKKKQNQIVLDDISFTVPGGTIFGIIGKSGAGKSTLLKCLNLLEHPDSGNIFIEKTNLVGLSEVELRRLRQNIGVVFQGFNLLESKTVADNIGLPLVIQGGHTHEQIKHRVLELLDLVGLTEYVDKYPASLSGGQKQRVGIARALATNPKILLSDEATSALDPQTTSSILDLMLDINQKLGVTIVVITHQMEVIRKICDFVMVLDKGKVVEQGLTTDVILHPKHMVTRSLVLEEDNHNYLDMIADFYKFDDKSKNAHLLLLSFIGDKAFEPILSKVTLGSGAFCSIIRGEMGRIKKTPFGQLLIEVSGNQEQLQSVFDILRQLEVDYEIIC